MKVDRTNMETKLFRQRLVKVLEDRMENNLNTCFRHPEKKSREDAYISYLAYSVALSDVKRVLEDFYGKEE